MRDISASSKSLSALLLTPAQFSDPRNEQTVLALLDRMSSDFHGVERIAHSEERDPGFRIALQSQQALLRDSRNRFAEGKKEYAEWRLRGLYKNCVGCHIRTGVGADLVAEPPRLDGASPDVTLAAAEMLVANHRFEDGSRAYMKVIREALAGKVVSGVGMEAAEGWLAVRVRVNGELAEAAASIDELLGTFAKIKGAKSAELSAALKGWADGLRALEGRTAGSKPVDEAHRLLAPVLEGEDRTRDEKKLPQTLLASGWLHTALESGSLSLEQRRRGTYLLAKAYTHLPVRSLEVFAPLYLEQCVREFPRTDEAKWCFADYEQQIVIESTGSDGTHIPEDLQTRMNELRGLAFE